MAENDYYDSDIDLLYLFRAITGLILTVFLIFPFLFNIDSSAFLFQGLNQSLANTIGIRAAYDRFLIYRFVLIVPVNGFHTVDILMALLYLNLILY